MPNRRKHTLIFLHIPKTAGVTFGEFLAKQYRDEEMARYKTAVPLREYYALLYRERRRLRFLRGHFPFGVHKFVRHPFLYLTFLREPTDRLGSLYYFFREWQDSPIYEQVRQMSFSEFLESGLTKFSDNGMVRQLSGLGNVPPYGQCTSAMLEQAKKNLEKYFLIGLVEEFDKSLAIFASLLGWENTLYEKQNITRKRPAKLTLSDSALALLEKNNRWDTELYIFGKQLYEEQCAMPQNIMRAKRRYEWRAKAAGFLFLKGISVAVKEKKDETDN